MRLLIMLAMLLSGSAFAQLRCVDKLITQGWVSGTHQLLQAEWRPTGPGTITTADATRIVNALLFGKLLCRENEITIDGQSHCLAIDANKPELITCQSNSSAGHFIVTTDTQQNASVIFHRAPRPVDPETETDAESENPLATP